MERRDHNRFESSILKNGALTPFFRRLA